MASANILQLTDASFQKDVLESDVPVLVDFWAAYCMPCRQIAPIIDDLAAEYTGKLKVGKMDTESNTAVAIKFGIRSIPTVMLFNKGAMVKQFIGLTPGIKRDYKAAIDSVVAR